MHWIGEMLVDRCRCLIIDLYHSADCGVWEYENAYFRDACQMTRGDVLVMCMCMKDEKRDQGRQTKRGWGQVLSV